MPRWRPSTLTESGSASVEFIAAVAVLLMPMLYLSVAVTEVQNQTLGVEAAARYLSRTVAAGASDAHADRVLAAVIDEYGVQPETVAVRMTCTTAGPCPRPGAIIHLTVQASVPLPVVGGVFGDQVAIPVEATAVQKISALAPETP